MTSTRTAIFTICSNNYMPYARTLLASLNIHYPTADLYICLVDNKIATERFYPSNCKVVLAEELGIDDFKVFAFQYEIMELNTAVKPFMFLRLFREGYDHVIYFDPDIMVFRPMESISAALQAGASFVLTPHFCHPAENESDPDDVAIMQAGIYNLGFLACGKGRETERILRWWARRLRYQCVVRPDRGIFVDQRFVDLVPAFAEHFAIVRDPTLNVAYWNLSQRSLTRTQPGWLVDGEPLTFFHFSGIIPGNFELLSKHTKLFRGDAITEPVKAIMWHYYEELVQNGLWDAAPGDYAYGRFASGAPIHHLIRKMFRERHLPWFGDPFHTYEEFAHDPCPGTSRHSSSFMVTNLMKFIWNEYPWAQQNFDFQRDGDVEQFVRWYAEFASSLLRIDPRLVEPVVERAGRPRFPAGAERLSPPESGRTDITVVGYLRTSSGVGEAGRQTVRSLSNSDLSIDAYDISLNVLAKRDDDSCDTFLSDKVSGRAQIFHVNADQLPLVLDHIGPHTRTDALRIAVPFWELAEFPEAWYPGLQQMDEIWAPSRFIQTALFRKLRMPVTYMPIALSFDTPGGFTRSYFGVPERKFLFFFSFDFLSFHERKNPRAVYQAFRKAFPTTRNDVGLVVKSLNGMHAQADLADLRREFADEPGVVLIDGTLTRTETLGLIGVCDCVISLHRSEGLGLLVAEAMALGKPVIATDYSATTAFVTPTTGFPVNYRLVSVGKDQYPHAAGHWADPDISHAAWLMRAVYSDDLLGRQKALAAKRHVEENFGMNRVSALQRKRLAELGFA